MRGMTNETAKAKKSVTAIIRDAGFIIAVVGVVLVLVGLIAKSPELFAGGIVVVFVGAAVGVLAAILWAAGLRR